MPRRFGDFTPATRRSLSYRAAFYCSNPKCRRLTIGPDQERGGNTVTGCAAHIRAAAPGGARYEADQPNEKRKSEGNGIWLCRECADMVDKDANGYPVELLEEWKAASDELIASVRQGGYHESLRLLYAGNEPYEIAHALVALAADRRAFWVNFDAEFPDRVLASFLDLRRDLNDLRARCALNGPLTSELQTLQSLLHAFFDRVERSDLRILRCDSNDPEWCTFSDALRDLRAAFLGLLREVAGEYEISLAGTALSEG